jgi:uncharacterized protein YaiL (DUF2058 family)
VANSFGDQFLKAGLVNKARLNEAKKSKSRQEKLKHKQKIEVVDEAAEAARKAAAEKAARDRELNRQKKEELERKAVQAQIRQLIALNRVPREDGEVGYNFQDGAAIRKIFVTEAIRDRLARGWFAIARFDDGYEVIPAAVAQKITQRDPTCIVSQAASRQEHGEDDPYADYQIPDDLMW